MDTIESFKVDHSVLLPGLYVSRRDRHDGVTVTTFDMRMTAPNREPPVDVAALHTVEHLAATFLRNSVAKSDIVYFGPMGCRTGCYLVMFGDKTLEDVMGLVEAMCEFIIGFEGDIPGATKEQCGNYLEQNLEFAKYYINRYLTELKAHKRTEYKML